MFCFVSFTNCTIVQYRYRTVVPVPPWYSAYSTVTRYSTSTVLKSIHHRAARRCDPLQTDCTPRHRNAQRDGARGSSFIFHLSLKKQNRETTKLHTSLVLYQQQQRAATTNEMRLRISLKAATLLFLCALLLRVTPVLCKRKSGDFKLSGLNTEYVLDSFAVGT